MTNHTKYLTHMCGAFGLLLLMQGGQGVSAQTVDTTGETDANNLSTYQASSSFDLFQTFAVPTGYSSLSVLRFSPIGGSGTGQVSIRPYDTATSTFSSAVYTQTFSAASNSISLQPSLTLDTTRTYAVYWSAPSGTSYSLTVLWTPSAYGYANGIFGYVATSSNTAYPDSSGDIEFYLSFAPLGPDTTNTQTAARANATVLRGVMDRRLSGLASMTNYDCSNFDKLGVCLSFQSRYSNFESFNEGAGVLTAAYRLADSFRLGAFVDYRAGEKEPTNIKFSNDLPTFGAFVGYSQHRDGTGLQGKVLAAVQTGNATLPGAM